MTANCEKPSWNGEPRERCCKSCKPLPEKVINSDGKAKCITDGCAQSSWNGEHGEKCGKMCGNAPPGVKLRFPVGLCLEKCGKPNNAPFYERCCLGCPNHTSACGATAPTKCDSPKCYRPAAPGGTACCTACTAGGAGHDDSCEKLANAEAAKGWAKLDPLGAVFKSVKDQFENTWDPRADVGVGGYKVNRPNIKEIWAIESPHLIAEHYNHSEAIGDVPVFGSGLNPANRHRRFHGTLGKCVFNGSRCSISDCAPCGIISNGQQMKFAKPGGAFFGVGQYVTSTSSGACRYAKKGKDIAGVVIVVGVAIGRADIVLGKDLVGCGPKCVCESDGKCLANKIPKTLGGSCLEDKPDRPVSSTGQKFNSRVVNAPNDAHCYIVHATKNGEPLLKTENEIVTFDDGATVPKYLIVFDSTKAQT